MTLDALILLSGTLIALLPFLGFPLKWDNVILIRRTSKYQKQMQHHQYALLVRSLTTTGQLAFEEISALGNKSF